MPSARVSSTDNGTALHEAATSCKLDVIKLLLDRGVDVWAKAKNNMTAEDILRSTHSKLTQEALHIINGHVNSQRTPDSDGEKDINGIPGPGRSGPGEGTPPIAGRPTPKPRSVFGSSVDSAHFMEANSSQSSSLEPQSPPPPIPPRISLKLTEAPEQPDPTPVVDTGQLTAVADLGAGRSRDASPMSGGREQPKKPPRKTPSIRKTEATQNAAASTAAAAAHNTSGGEPSTSLVHRSGSDRETPPSHVEPHANRTGATAAAAAATDEDVPPAPPSFSEAVGDRGKSGGEGEDGVPVLGGERSGEEEGSESLFVRGGNILLPNNDGDRPASVKRESIYANATVIAAEEETRGGKPHSLRLEEGTVTDGTDTAMVEQGGGEGATSTCHRHTQPPTPDYPPPSPNTAVQGIQLKIYPQARRKSKDMETITESSMAQVAMTTAAASQSISEDRRRSSGGAEAAKVVSGGDLAGPSRASPVCVMVGQILSQGSDIAAEGEKPRTSTSATPKSSTRSSSSSSSGSSSVMTTSDADVMATTITNTVEVEGEVVEMRRSVSDWDSNVFAASV
ncbi:hypothetical protein ACOMHN_008717 [Nucella lapillus]